MNEIKNSIEEIFDWLREQMEEKSVQGFDGNGNPVNVRFVVSIMAEDIITEAEAKWKEKEAELRANVIEEFAEKLKSDYYKHEIVNMLKYGEDYSRYGREKSLDEYIDEIAEQMKGEKE